MTNRSKNIGTKAESDVVRWATPRGFGGADETSKAQRITLNGANDQGDVSLCPGVMVEVKGGAAAENASDAVVAAWLIDTETERRNRGADVGFLVRKRKGKGAKSAGQWHAHMTGWTFVYLAGGLPGVGSWADAVREAGVTLPAVAMTFDDALTLLRSAGYGDPITDTEKATP